MECSFELHALVEVSNLVRDIRSLCFIRYLEYSI